MAKRLIILFLLLPALAYADPMTLVWIDNSGAATNDAEDGFNIWRSINGSTETKAGNVAANVTKFVEDVAPTTIVQTVCYSVSAFNKAGESVRVAAATCKTVPAIAPIVPAPPAKVDLSFTGATGEVTIDGKTVPFTDADGSFKITAAKTMKLDAERIP